MPEEFQLRADILKLSEQIGLQCFNVTAYRKKHSDAPKQIFPASEFVTTDHESSRKLDNYLEKEPDLFQYSTKRLSATACARKRNRSHVSSHQPRFSLSVITRHNNYNDRVESATQRKGFSKMQMRPKGQKLLSAKPIKSKKHEPPKEQSKVLGEPHQAIRQRSAKKNMSRISTLKQKHLENWLNQILVEYCQQQRFDSTIVNSALKQFGIDSSSLLSKGINPAHCSRIYQSLFVYSMGFNTLLKQIGASNMTLRKTIWKVYAILLEYCAEGSFETMIGEIERDKARKLAQLKEETEKRQTIIDNNDEINQEKNAKIFKELKFLKEENGNLENEKTTLLEDFKEAEQAFNEEVALRLRYESKINEIHGIHRELTIKHQRLFDDLNIKSQNLKALQDKHLKQIEKYLSLKCKNDKTVKQLQSLKTTNKYNLQLVDNLKQAAKANELNNISQNTKKQLLKDEIKDLQVRISQLNQQRNNLEVMLSLQEKSRKKLQEDYQKALDENNRKNATIVEDMKRISDLLFEKKEFCDRNGYFFAEIDVLKSTISQKQRERDTNQLRTKEMKELLQSKQARIAELESKNTTIEQNIADCFSKIEEMRRVKNVFEQQLQGFKKKDQFFNEILSQKDKEIQLLKEKLGESERLQTQYSQIRSSLQDKITVMAQKMQAADQSYRKKIDRLKLDNIILLKQAENYKQIHDIKVSELESYQKLYDEVTTKLRNEIFERRDLDLRYKQSLNVVESQSEHIKSLNRKISQFGQKQTEIRGRMKSLEFALENKEKAWKAEKQAAEKTILELRQAKSCKAEFLHPMLQEDTMSHLMRQREIYSEEIAYLNSLKKDHLDVQARLESQLEKLRATLTELKGSHQFTLSKKQTELAYEKEKVKLFSDNIEELEKLLGVYRAREQAKDSSRDSEKRHLDMIREKNEKINELLKEIQKMHDNNGELLTRIGELEQEIENKQDSFNRLLRQFELHKTEISKLNEKASQNSFNNASNQRRQSEEPYSIQSKEQYRSQTPETLNPKREENPVCKIQINPLRKDSDRIRNVLQAKQKKDQSPWRNDFSKKMKNAYQYYHK